MVEVASFNGEEVLNSQGKGEGKDTLTLRALICAQRTAVV